MAKGPRLTDEQFFEAMNLDYPGLEGVRAAVGRRDWAAAKREFVAHLRRRERPVWFFDWRERGRRRRPAVQGRPMWRRRWEDEGGAPDTTEADRIVANELTSCNVAQKFGEEIDWELDPINYKEWTWQLSRHPFWVTLGRAYWATGDEQYARAFVRQMTHWAENVLVPVGWDGNAWKTDAKMGTDATNCWRTIECGIRMAQTWMPSFFLFLSSPSFSDEAVCAMVKSVVEHARHLLRWPRTGNWLTMEANGQLHVGAMFPELREAGEWARVAVERLYRELDAQVYPDGAQVELSSGYHQVSLRNFVGAFEVARINHIPIPADAMEKLEKMYHYNLYLVMPDGTMPALNDGGHTVIRSSMEEGALFFPHRKDFRWAASGEKEGEAPAVASYAFPYAGHFVMRSGWDADALYLFFDGGPFGYGHQHEDKLNLVVHAYGRTHVEDAGNYPYDSSQWRRYVISTRAHNTVMVDGMEQNQRGKPREEYVVKTPLPHTWVTAADHDYAAAAYDLGYGPERDRTVTHDRRVFFVRPGPLGEGYWIVTDFLTASDGKAHRYEAMFHLDAEGAEVTGMGAVATQNREASNLTIYPVSSARVVTRVVAGQEEPAVQGWIPRGGPYKCQPIPTALFDVEGSGVTALAYVLYPTPKGASSPVQGVDLLPVQDGIGLRVRFADGRTDLFVQAQGGGRERKFGGFTTDAEATLVRLDAQGRRRAVIAVKGR